MKRRYLAVLAMVAFSMGVMLPTAYAGSVQGAYQKVAGGSASCTMVQASVNNDNERGGSRTRNFEGCNSSNDVVYMPAGYLGTRAGLYRAPGTFCGQSTTFYTTSSAYSISTSTPIRGSLEDDCPIPGTFQGDAIGYRYSNGDYLPGYAESPYTNFN